MKFLRAWAIRLAGLFSAGKRKEVAEEFELHLQMQVEDNVRSGMTPHEARRQAMIKLGSVESAQEAYTEQGTIPSVESLLQDIRFSLRQLRRNPGFTATAVLMLSLGMTASVAIFSFVDAALIKPLPYHAPDRLVDVNESVAVFPRSNLSYLDYLDWKEQNEVFQSMAAFGGRGFMLTTVSGPKMVAGARVSDNFFKTLGVAPILGRDFYEGEDLPSAPYSAMLSYRAWQERFGGNKDVIGQKIVLSGIPATVVGVLPQEFSFALRGEAEVWATLHVAGECDLRRSCHNLYGVARLKDGVTIEAAKANINTIAEQLEREYPQSNKGQGSSVQPLYEAVVGDIRPILLVLLSGAGLLLLIACVNVSSLLLVRFENRRREIAVRGALGASNSRMVRQFVTESMVLVMLGSAAGLGLAYGGMQIVLRHISKDLLFNMPYLRGIEMNGRVMGFALVVAALATLVFSIPPLLRLPRMTLREGLNNGDRGSSGVFWRRFGSNLVVVELAVAMVLLVGAGLLGKSFYRLLHVDLGFEPDHLATMAMVPPAARYTKDDQRAALGREVLRRVQSLPGVTSVGFANIIAVSGNGNTDWLRFVGKPFNGEHNEVNEREVSPDYFKALQTTLISGRYFTDADDATKQKVAIINQTLAKRYFPGEDPIGKQFGDTELKPESIKEIVGVVADVREGSLDSNIMPAAYYPFSQSPDTSFTLVVRTSQPEEAVLSSIRQTVRELDPEIATVNDSTMNRRINESQTAYLHRSSAWLVGGFASMALLLGVLGLYGVIAYSVSQRTREIGVRMALGAQRSSVYQLILSEAGRLTALGVVVGVACSIAAASLMRKLLFGVSSWDATTIGAVVIVLGISALCASYIPARRAASVNPVEALRSE